MKEIRSIHNSEFRVVPRTRKVEGYALLFDSESRDLGGFKEVIKPEALNGVLERSDIFALFNHNSEKVFARSTNGKGTLKLSVDERGLKYKFSAPQTELGNELLNAIQRGDLRNSSFAFTIAEGGDTMEKRSDGSYIRTITQFDELFDVSPVWTPAYADTTVATRSFNKFKEEERAIEEENEENDDEEVVDETTDEMEEEQVDETTDEETDAEPTDGTDNDGTDTVEDEEDATDEERILIEFEGKKYNIPQSVLDEYLDETADEEVEDDMEEASNEEEEDDSYREYLSKLEEEIADIKNN